MTKPIIGWRDSNLSILAPQETAEFVLDPWNPHEVEVFTDLHLHAAEASKARVKIAWLLEPRAVNPFAYMTLESMVCDFDAVFTSEMALTTLSGRIHYCPWGDCWIPRDKWGVHEGDGVSIIASPKANTEGQRFRHEVIARFPSLPRFGSMDRSDLGEKYDWLAPYSHSVVIENNITPGYFTEKLLDCLAVGTVPLYRGDPLVTDIFESVVPFTSLDELAGLLESPPAPDPAAQKRDIARVGFYADVFTNLWRSGLRELV